MEWGRLNKLDAVEKEPEYYIFAGTAYTKLMQGDNPTTRVTADMTDRQSYYNDPALKLSETDLKEFNGAEKYPLCIEHDPDKVVGEVYHTWVNAGNRKALKMMGRIDLKTKLGKDAAASVDNGTFSGLSVGYGAKFAEDWEVTGKSFREISLVHEPFFPDCKLAPQFSITASKQTIKNSGRINNDGFSFYIPISAMAEQQQPTAVTGNELMGETYKLKLENERMQNEMKLQQQRAQDELQKLKSERERDATEAAKMKEAFEKMVSFQQQQDAVYAAEKMPIANAFIESVVASKIPISEEAKKAYIENFCRRECAETSRIMEAKWREEIELRASNDAKEKRLVDAEAKARKLEEELAAERSKSLNLSADMTQAKRLMNNNRSDFAKALSNTERADDEARTDKTAELNASALRPGQVLCRPPHPDELPFLQQHGYTSQANVNASLNNEDGDLKPYRTSVPAPPTHRNLLHPVSKERILYASARFHEPGKALFAWMCNMPYLRDGNLNSLVTMNKDYDSYQPKLMDNWRRPE